MTFLFRYINVNLPANKQISINKFQFQFLILGLVDEFRGRQYEID